MTKYINAPFCRRVHRCLLSLGKALVFSCSDNLRRAEHAATVEAVRSMRGCYVGNESGGTGSAYMRARVIARAESGASPEPGGGHKPSSATS
jgi:hypothetical protein